VDLQIEHCDTLVQPLRQRLPTVILVSLLFLLCQCTALPNHRTVDMSVAHPLWVAHHHSAALPFVGGM